MVNVSLYVLTGPERKILNQESYGSQRILRVLGTLYSGIGETTVGGYTTV